MSTTVAIVNWNSGERLRKCIESILSTRTPAEVLVVDNASSDDSLDRTFEFRDRVHFIRNSVNRGLAAAINQAVRTSQSGYILLLNPDVTVSAGVVSMLEEFMDKHPRAGAIGGFVNKKYPPRRFPTVISLFRENLGFPANSLVSTGPDPVTVDQPAAAALLMRRDAYDEIGGLDEQFYPAWYEDVDLCRRLKNANWEIYFAPRAEFVHEGGYSASALGTDAFVEAYYHNQIRYARKHMGVGATAVVRAAIILGMAGRIVARPRNARAYAKVLLGAISKW